LYILLLSMLMQNFYVAGNFRDYFLQLRRITAERLLEIAFNADGTQNKWWMQFHRRKFMNLART
jgi:hypothetical protein